MDDTCVLIGLQVCFHSAMKHENGMSNVVCLSQRIYSTHFVNRPSFFLLTMKHVFHAFIACWKPWQSLWEFSSRWKPSTASRVFTDLLSNSPKHSPRFSPCYEGTENMFYFLNINDLFDLEAFLLVHCTYSSSNKQVEQQN